MHIPGRGDGALRHHRVSILGASYFLTLCTKDRLEGLSDEIVARAVRHEIAAVEADGHWLLRAAVVMPDHLHLLIRLTGQLAISRCIARFKTKTRPALANRQLAWQSNFFEHRLRPDDPVEEVVRYIFLNPHRTGLTNQNEFYPWFWLGADETAWFKPTLDHGEPFPEWLR